MRSKRAFVLLPLVDVAPELQLPAGTVAELLARIDIHGCVALA